MRKRVTGLVMSIAGVVGLGLAGTAAPAGAEGYPPAENGIAVACTTPAPGETVGVTARSFTPGAEVAVTIDPGPATLGSAAAGGDGAVMLDVAIPNDIQPGNHTITATGQAADGVLTLTARVTVGAGCAGAPSEGATPPGAAPSEGDSGGGALPLTGSGLTTLLLQLALVLAAAGGVFLALSRRRRTHAAPTPS
jgi:hypothetical protein